MDSSSTTLPPQRHPMVSEHTLACGLSAAAIVLLAVLPLASFAISGLLLINLPVHTTRQLRWLMGLVLAISMSMMAGSRPVDAADLSNDILVYHDLYLGLAAGDLSELFRFGVGIEVALPALMLLWANVLPPLSINGLMFCLSLTASLLLMLWIESSFYSAKELQRPALLGISLLLLNIYFATQLSRQFLSLIVLLYAFTAQTRGRQLLFVALAASFHLTALPFYGLYLLARRGWLGWAAILLAAFALRIYFAQLLVAFDVLPEAAADKLVYYAENTEESTDADIGSLRMVFLLAVASLFALLGSGLRPHARTLPWLAVPWLTALVHYLLLPIPLASLRVTLMVHSVASGFIVYQMFAGRAHKLLLPALNVLLLYKVAAFATAQQGANLRPSILMFSTFFA